MIPNGPISLNAWAKSLEITMHGDWGKARYMLRDLPLNVLEASKKAQKTVADKYRRTLIRNIKTNKFGFQLGIDYAIWKAKKGGDPNKVAFWTGLYIRSIITDEHGLYTSVRIKPGIRYSTGFHGKKGQSNITVDQLARILEKGSVSRSISPKPFWKMTYHELGGTKGLGRTFIRSLTQRVRGKITLG